MARYCISCYTAVVMHLPCLQQSTAPLHVLTGCLLKASAADAGQPILAGRRRRRHCRRPIRAALDPFVLRKAVYRHYRELQLGEANKDDGCGLLCADLGLARCLRLHRPQFTTATNALSAVKVCTQPPLSRGRADRQLGVILTGGPVKAACCAAAHTAQHAHDTSAQRTRICVTLSPTSWCVPAPARWDCLCVVFGPSACR